MKLPTIIFLIFTLFASSQNTHRINVEAIGIRSNNYTETGQKAVDIVKSALADAVDNLSKDISFVVTSEFSFMPGYIKDEQGTYIGSNNAQKEIVAKNTAIRLRKLGDLYYIDKKDSNKEIAGHLEQLQSLAAEYKVTIFAGTWWTKISNPEYPNIPTDAVANTLIVIDKNGQISGIDYKVAQQSDGYYPGLLRKTSESDPQYETSQELYAYLDKSSKIINVYDKANNKLTVFPQICAELLAIKNYALYQGAKADLMVMSYSWLEPGEAYAKSLKEGSNNYYHYLDNLWIYASGYDVFRPETIALFSDINTASVFRMDGQDIETFMVKDRYSYGKTYIDKPIENKIVSEQGSFIVKQQNDSWNKVNLQKSYNDPVIIFSPLTANSKGAAGVRVRNVTSNSFEWQIEEWDYLDGKHGEEYVNYTVIESGEYSLSDGRKLIAGNVIAQDSFGTKYFSNEFKSDSPVIVAQITSASDKTKACIKLKNISYDSFEIKVQGQELNGKVHGQERISYIAADPGDYSELGILKVGSTEIRHRWAGIPFSYTNTPVFLASSQTNVDDDPAIIRMKELSTNGVDLKLEEEKSLDKETRHSKESVGFIIFEK